MKYFIKHWVGALASPGPATLALLALGLIFWRSRRPAGARALFVCAALLGYFGSTSLLGNLLLGPLEAQYPPLGDDQPLPAVDYVVVLGSGYSPHDHVPVTAALSPEGLARIVEGIRIARRLKSARLIVSGGALPGDQPSSVGYAELARSLGTPGESLTLSSEARDTSEEAAAVVKLLGQAPFILVTSAYHMPRAMRLMQRAGARPIPAPTSQRTGLPARWSAWVPGSEGLGSTERAAHEYVGLTALALGWQ